VKSKKTPTQGGKTDLQGQGYRLQKTKQLGREIRKNSGWEKGELKKTGEKGGATTRSRRDEIGS